MVQKYINDINVSNKYMFKHLLLKFNDKTLPFYWAFIRLYYNSKFCSISFSVKIAPYF